MNKLSLIWSMLFFACVGISQPNISDHYLKELERNVGTWIADNSAYQNDQEDYPAYMLVWKWGWGHTSLDGKLFAITETGNNKILLWTFLQFWDAEKEMAAVIQFGSDGTTGQGYLEWIRPDSNQLLQHFQSPEGDSYSVGHRRKCIPGREISESFIVSENGEWRKNRQYTWIQQPVRGQLTEHQMLSRFLENNVIGEPVTRDVLVYTPPGYQYDAWSSYPVLYLLHGYGEHPRVWLKSLFTQGFHLPSAMDSLIENGKISEMIVVMPDAGSRYGGSWYTNSPAGGSWEDYIIEELIPFIDRNYRTIPSARGLAGHSMGGYGALRMALSHPDLFRGVYAMSPVNLVDDRIAKIKYPDLLERMQTPDSIIQFNLFDSLLISKSLAFVPDNNTLFHFAPLFEHVGSEFILRDSIWERWASHLIINRLDFMQLIINHPEIVFDHGDKDPLVSESREFAKALKTNHIPFTFLEYPGGHTDKFRYRLENYVLPFFSGLFSSPK